MTRFRTLLVCSLLLLATTSLLAADAPKSPSLYTLPIGVRQLQQLNRTNWPLLMAAAVVATVPAVLVFLAVQRYLLVDSRQSK